VSRLVDERNSSFGAFSLLPQKANSQRSEPSCGDSAEPYRVLSTRRNAGTRAPDAINLTRYIGCVFGPTRSRRPQRPKRTPTYSPHSSKKSPMKLLDYITHILPVIAWGATTAARAKCALLSRHSAKRTGVKYCVVGMWIVGRLDRC
jgi:hypothetical protein